MFKSTYESPVISIDHNQYVVGNYTWQSNYVSGLQVLYIDQENYDLKVKPHLLEHHLIDR